MPFRYSGHRFVCGPREGFVQKRVFSDGYLPGGQPYYVLPNITDNNGMKPPGLLLKFHLKLFWCIGCI